MVRRLLLVSMSAAAAACTTQRWVVTDPAAVAASRSHQRSGLEAADRGDIAGYLDHFRAAAELRPGHPSLLYHLARAYALADSGQLALEQLRALARMGVGGDVADDSAFSAILDHVGFDSVRAVLSRNAEPFERSQLRLSVAGGDFLPEGLAYDPRARAFFLGSVHHGVILRVEGSAIDTFARRGPNTWGMMGMVVDTARRWLWVTSTAAIEVRGVDSTDVGRAALLAYDLDGAEFVLRIEAPDDGAVHWFGDVALTPSGTVYVSDSRRPGVYRLRSGLDGLDPVVVGEPLQSPQGIAAMDDGHVYLADYALGVVRISSDGAVEPLPFPTDAGLLGIDGLYAWRGTLIGIQNGFSPLRVIRMELGNGGARVDRVQVLESNHSRYPEPTLGTVVGDTLFYVANADWSRFATGVPSGVGEDPVVLALPLR